MPGAFRTIGRVGEIGEAHLAGSRGKVPRFAAPVGREAEPAQAWHQLRILVADDDRDQVLTLTVLLCAEGHEVRGVHSGRELIEALAGFEPDVLILDIKLPDTSGFELAETIHQRYGQRRPMLIAISGVFRKGVDRILCEMVGFDHHLTKPFAFDALLELIRPLTHPTTQLVARAAALIGREQLIRQLEISASLLDDWIHGRAAMPPRKLFLLAAILEKAADGD